MILQPIKLEKVTMKPTMKMNIDMKHTMKMYMKKSQVNILKSLNMKLRWLCLKYMIVIKKQSQPIHDQVNSDAEESVEKKINKDKKKLKKTMTPIKRRIIDTDGRSAEEEIYVELLIEDRESLSEKGTEHEENQSAKPSEKGDQLSPEELLANAEDFLDEVRDFRAALEKPQDPALPATPTRDPAKDAFPSTGLQ